MSMLRNICSLALVALGLSLSLTACNSDSPTGTKTAGVTVTCPDVSGDPIEISLGRLDWEGTTVQFNGDDNYTQFRNRAPLTGVATPVVGPGGRVLIRVTFENPIKFTSKDAWVVSLTVTGSSSGYRGEGEAVQDALFTGKWTAPFYTWTSCVAANADWVLSGTTAILQGHPMAGDHIDCVVFDYQIPALLNIGEVPVAAAIPLTEVTWTATIDGDHSSGPPPITFGH